MRDIRANLHKVIESTQRKLAMLDAIGDDRDYLDGAMVRAVVRCTDGQVRTYLLLKISPIDHHGLAKWYHTGKSPHLSDRSQWSGILEWLTRVELISWEVLQAAHAPDDGLITLAADNVGLETTLAQLRQVIQDMTNTSPNTDLRYWIDRLRAIAGLPALHNGPGGLRNHGHVPELEPQAIHRPKDM